MLIQEYISGNDEILKVYVIHEQVTAVHKPLSPTSSMRRSRPCPVSPEVREIALSCGQVFGLGLYGLDVIESPGNPMVVDLNYFPSYQGVPEAAGLMADYIEGYALKQYPELAPRETMASRARLAYGSSPNWPVEIS